MNRTIRVRNRKVDVELTFWKLLPVLFMVLIILMSTMVTGTNAVGDGPLGPRFE